MTDFEDIFLSPILTTGKPNHLFHNNGNMTFTDVAVQAGEAGGNDPLSVCLGTPVVRL